MNSAPHAAIAEKLQAIELEMNMKVIDRTDVIRGLLLGLISKQHVFLYGPPGTGKSYTINTLVRDHIVHAPIFSWLMTRFTDPSELFGPISAKGLRNDEYYRLVTGKLPEAVVVFLDELFKMNSAIGNTLLTALNERVFYNNGQAHNIPLVMLVGASNELPFDDGRNDLGAFYDRLSFRFETGRLSAIARKRLRDMKLDGVTGLPAQPTQIDLSEINSLYPLMKTVSVPNTVRESHEKIWDALEKQSILPSDRKFDQSWDIVRAGALYNGRLHADDEDLFPLEHVLWDRPEDRKTVAQVIAQSVDPASTRLKGILDRAQTLFDEAAGAQAVGNDADTFAKMTQANQEFKKLQKTVHGMIDQYKADGKPTVKLDDAVRRIGEMNRTMITSMAEYIGMADMLKTGND